jgi:type I restriction enzyme S subunit
LDQQRQIVVLLDRAAEIRRRVEAARAKARAIIPALFLDTFGDPATNPKRWPVARLGEFTDFSGGTSLPAGIPFRGQSNGFLHCKVSTLALKGNERIISYSLEWGPNSSSKAAVARPGSVVFPKRGAAISTNRKRMLGRSAILDPNLMGVFPHQKILNTAFLLGWFGTFRLEDISSGSTVPQLNQQDLSPLQIICPPLDLQTAYAEQFQRIEALARKLEAAEAKAEAMSAALSAEVFG